MIWTVPGRFATRSIEFAGRLDALDGVRTIAVLLVFVYHARPELARGGNYGVDVFFVLSGFVITLLLLKEWEKTHHLRFGRFYLNRLARLWPALLVVTAVVGLSSLVFPHGPQAGELIPVITASTYVENIARAFHLWGVQTDAALGHTWSLAVEEQFYLVWPVLFLLLVTIWKVRGAAIAAFALALAPIFVRAALWQNGAGNDRIFNMTDTRADQLLIGCGLALTLTALRGRGVVLARALALGMVPAAVMLLAAALLIDEWNTRTGAVGAFLHVVTPLLVAVVAAVLIGGLATSPDHPLARALGSRWLSWPGKNLSYGFYLWHYPIVITLIWLGVPTVLRLVLGLLATAGIAYFSSRFVEAPIRQRVRAALDSRAPHRLSAATSID